MRELPILFSTPMVQATLENRKTMTRRLKGLKTINIIPDSWKQPAVRHTVGNKEIVFLFTCRINILDLPPIEVVPKYQKGDHVWIKETFFDTRPYKSVPLFANSPDFIYRADDDAFIGEHKWKPSMFMPKAAARIWLECTGVRCERLQELTEADAIAEGIKVIEKEEAYFDYLFDGKCGSFLRPRGSFFSLWIKINTQESFDLNPWVFVYEFKRIEKP